MTQCADGFFHRRHWIFAVAALVTAADQAGSAEPSPPTRRMGVLLFDGAESWQFFRDGLGPALARLGWVEGRNLHSDWRFADGDAARLAVLADGLLRDGANVLLTRGTPATRALQRATRTVPIVTGVGDPVGAGFAASLGAPGGNITGLSYMSAESTQKQIELLREVVPGISRLLVLLPASRAPLWAELVDGVERAARVQGLESKVVVVDGLEALRFALRAARGAGSAAAFVFSFGTELAPMDIAAAMLDARVPAVFGEPFYVAAGGLMGWRLYWDDQTRNTAVQLDKALRGTNAAQIPFEQPTRSELTLNAKTARALGLTIPRSLLLRADKVIQ